MAALVSMIAGAFGLGFAAGLFSFKVKTRWCRHCGTLKVCINCLHSRTPARRGVPPIYLPKRDLP